MTSTDCFDSKTITEIYARLKVLKDRYPEVKEVGRAYRALRTAQKMGYTDVISIPRLVTMLKATRKRIAFYEDVTGHEQPETPIIDKILPDIELMITDPHFRYVLSM